MTHPAADANPAPLPSPALLQRLVECAVGSIRLRDLYEQLAARLTESNAAAECRIVEGSKGRWRWFPDSPPTDPPSGEALSEALDRQQPIDAGWWLILPLSDQPDNRHLLAVRRRPSETANAVRARWQPMTAMLGKLCLLAQQWIHARDRAGRLESMLGITTQWNQTRETSQLLEAMAEASTRLLDAQRATIFLWDRDHHQLIGRPAMGVAAGEIRVPESTGVVGQVIAAGQPVRVDSDIAPEQAQIDRTVDRDLGFETRTLLCVPLKNPRGEVIGAFELINKRDGNFSEQDQEALSELAASAAVAITNSQYLKQLLDSKRTIADEAANHLQWIGDSQPMQQVRATLKRVAPTELAVLILGDNGTGKEVAAQMIHYLSPRRDQVLVAVNCAAITESLLESELFGHEKGAFTDAHEPRQGKFELANGGTLFLDEIGDMSPGGQAKLLRVLEEKVVVRVGGSKPIRTDVRVIAATNQDLAALVQHKKFREDLYFRLNVVSLELPPLRERGGDVLLLAQHFLQQFCRASRRQPPELSAAAEQALLRHSWPGNVRELRNMMERIAYLLDGDVVTAADLPFMKPVRADESSLLDAAGTLADATAEFQRLYIQQRIQEARGNMTAAAEQLGVHRSNLYRKMKQLGMDVDDSTR